jgi:outer membrane protein OmpA-like peptidoglycan-associated protein
MERAQESADVSTGAAPDLGMRVVTEKRIARRSPSGKLMVVGLLVPALIAGAGGLFGGAGAEETLVAEATAALRADGIKGVRLEANGPFLTAYVPTRVDSDAVESVVDGVAGVSTVTSEQAYASKKEARACNGFPGKLNRATGKQRIPFVGESPRLSSEGRRMVVRAAKLVAACGSAKVYVGGHTDPSTSDGGTLSLRRARAMIGVMRRAGAPAERLVPRGYGAQHPVSDGDSPAAKLGNQRGSIILVQG